MRALFSARRDAVVVTQLEDAVGVVARGKVEPRVRRPVRGHAREVPRRRRRHQLDQQYARLHLVSVRVRVS